MPASVEDFEHTEVACFLCSNPRAGTRMLHDCTRQPGYGSLAALLWPSCWQPPRTVLLRRRQPGCRGAGHPGAGRLLGSLGHGTLNHGAQREAPVARLPAPSLAYHSASMRITVRVCRSRSLSLSRLPAPSHPSCPNLVLPPRLLAETHLGRGGRWPS